MKEIIYALRCASTGEKGCKQTECPYYKRDSEEEVKEWCRKNEIKYNPEFITSGCFDECDIDTMMQDAAYMLEKMMKEGKQE